MPTAGYAYVPVYRGATNFEVLQHDFGVPQNDFGVPQNDFGVPQNDFGVPQNDFGVPQNDFEVPQNDFGVPQNDFEVPQNDFGVLQNDFGVLQNDFQVLQHDFEVSVCWFLFFKRYLLLPRGDALASLLTAVFMYLNHICCRGARPCAPTAWSIYLKIAVRAGVQAGEPVQRSGSPT
ncbi:MAG: hypothetical protein V7K89_11045 [Nostoc sp.]|uniref:hypothetical protein n=1 Tax=Nostoc sp. TaxID=1180 RepID=UPI002FFB3D36